MKHEPAPLEIFLTRLAFFLYGKSVYKAFADRLPLEGREQVLDFGCGMGTVAYYVAKKLPHGHLTCLDISEQWMNVCRKTLRGYGNITFQQAESPKFANESFNLVYSHFVLHDIPVSELKRIISALAESLKSGGVFVFREPLKEMYKISVIKHLIEQNGLSLKDSRITDIPLLGNALESVYTK
ncbi:MAG: class I SAM-dependent methyltransferase [Anaerovoracaceae bacterium]|jgi:ubiquinone/menaquinone biosynthesis C-methylase UbiE|nr:class I SAM-dependent methyltransferase [Clostridiales bacterium]